MKAEHQLLLLEVSTFLSKSAEFEKNKTIQYKDVQLYPSEIHLLLFLFEKNVTGVMDIAKSLGVTKGAVSQNLIRLEKKGVLVREKSPEGRHKVQVVFSQTGEALIEQCVAMRDRLQDEFGRVIGSYSDKEKGVIRDFLQSSNRIFDRFTV